MEDITFQLTELITLLIIASAVAVAVKYIRLPYTIALVLVGLFAGTLRLIPEIRLTEELIFFIILPPLLFEGAINMDIQQFRANIKPVGVLAVFGVLISTIFTGYAIHVLLNLPLILSLLFGAMISPTDPVSVLATFKALGVPRRLSLILEGESVLNDGTGVVLFSILLEMMRIGVVDITAGILKFIFVVVGGVVVGVILGYFAYRIFSHIDDHLIEVTITLILAFSCFIIAENFHVSGVIAVVVAGLIIGNYGRYFAMSPSTRVSLTTFWGFVVFLVNSIVFLLIGLDIHVDALLNYGGAIAVAIMVVVVSRAISVYPFLNILNFGKDKIPFLWQHVIFWGGLHGTIPVALALGLTNLPYRELIVNMVFGVVLFSLVIQGLSLELLVKKSTLTRKDEKWERYEELIGKNITLRAAKRELESMVSNGEIPVDVAEKMIQDIDDLLRSSCEETALLIRDETVEREIWISAWRKALHAQKSALRDALIKGLISEAAARKIDEEIDAELSNLEE
ncbi:MAG TPA: Na+/H+ antiporter [Archaeoglobaceae archaeon]|nr:Na+/H+ antiporter [Archaeoglobaceae archaeon]